MQVFVHLAHLAHSSHEVWPDFERPSFSAESKEFLHYFVDGETGAVREE